MKRKLLVAAILVLLPISMTSYGQYKMTQEEYAEKYAPMAIKKMQQYGIPASITLAQGILESGCGGSRLAVEANNHFGIKCKVEWTGERIYHDDDQPQECFRKYSSVEESYNDHSIFLTTRSRYAELFKLESTDYKGWAYGLKAAGYATSPTYAERLVSIIEQNRLYKYDTEGIEKKEKPAPKVEKEPAKVTPAPQVVNDAVKTGEINGARYMIARTGDSFTSMSLKSGIPVKTLLKYNDLSSERPLNDGEIVFVEKKASKNTTESIHIVKSRTTLYEISQLYGISFKSLKKMNQRDYASGTLPVGAEIHLR